MDAGLPAEHGDLPQDLEMIKPLVEAVQFLAEQLEVVNERLNKVEGLVVDDLIGGITGLYKKNQRTTGIGGLREKYGPQFEPHKDVLEAFYPGKDVFEEMYDLMEKMKGDEDFSDEKFDGEIQNSLKALLDKVSRIRGEAPNKEAEELNAAAPIEPGEPKEEDPDDHAKLIMRVKAMSAKAPKDF